MSAKPKSQPRKSLKQSLKDLFVRKPQAQPSPAVGSGVLRKAEASNLYQSGLSTTSLFPDFTDDRLDVSDFAASRAIPNRFAKSTRRASIYLEQRQALLPATSLSQFDLHQTYVRQAAVPRKAVSQGVTPSFRPVVSREASFATISTASYSTLRLQPSYRTLAQEHPLQGSSTAPKVNCPAKHVSWLQSPTASAVSEASLVTLSTHSLHLDQPHTRLVDHFKSFCILDTAVVGCPVVATSQELRYIFDVGEQFVLNNFECEDTTMDIVTGQDAAGDPVTHLVLFAPLVIPSSGRSRFMLASLIDVTRFIHDAASLPEDSQYSDKSTVESDPRTPLHEPQPFNWFGSGYRLSEDDLLGGCLLPEDRSRQNFRTSDVPDDIWLNLANEELEKMSTTKSNPGSTQQTKNSQSSSNASYSSTANSSPVDELLGEFMGGLKELYSDFFLLGKSPLNDTYYEICNVSPVVHAGKEYIHGHLSRTGAQGLLEMSEHLAAGSPFDMAVKWGTQGVDKRLYCSPLYGQNSVTWVCFLVDPKLPALW